MCVSEEIALPQSAWLAREAMQPFEPGTLHPNGCPTAEPGYMIEAAANTETEWDVHLAPEPIQEPFLGGGPHCHEQQVSPG
jgi:hypothetical protein